MDWILEREIGGRNRKNWDGGTIAIRVTAGSQLQSIRVDRWTRGEKAEIRQRFQMRVTGRGFLS